MGRHLLVGLGNPGPKYAQTRHNIGFMAVERLASRWGLSLTREKFKGVYEVGLVGGVDAALLKPLTFMNLSGQSVQPAASFFSVEPEQIVVFHDEIDLPCGELKIKMGGGHGGHNGLRDIIARLGTRDFVRLRLGVGRPERGDVTNWVLGRFSEEERVEVEELIEEACDAAEMILGEGVAAAQNRFHGA